MADAGVGWLRTSFLACSRVRACVRACVQHHLSLYKMVQNASSCVDNAEPQVSHTAPGTHAGTPCAAAARMPLNAQRRPQSYHRTQELKRQIKKATGGERRTLLPPRAFFRPAKPV
eukprot:COSAG02_NODE_3332_length_6919_cov_3.232551_8_plen_116_part_00